VSDFDSRKPNREQPEDDDHDKGKHSDDVFSFFDALRRDVEDDDDFDDDDDALADDDEPDDSPFARTLISKSGDDSARRTVSTERALEILECGDVQTEYGILRWSSNYAFLVAVTHDDITMNAVYKPQRGERPLWDFPDGTLCYRELASFLTSHELGWQIVPPTVLREGPRGLGSVQMFIEHDPQVNFFSFNENPGVLLTQLHKIAVFDAVINNADRKGGHCLLDPDNHLWGIDHGITFHSAHKLRTVIWEFAGQPIPDALLDDLDRLCVVIENPASSYRQRLNNLLSAVEIKACQSRIRNLLKVKKFPLPGPGPNYPWPPV